MRGPWSRKGGWHSLPMGLRSAAKRVASDAGAGARWRFRFTRRDRCRSTAELGPQPLDAAWDGRSGGGKDLWAEPPRPGQTGCVAEIRVSCGGRFPDASAFYGERCHRGGNSAKIILRWISMQFERITLNPAVATGKPCIRDLRFPVSRLLGLLAAGETRESILRAYLRRLGEVYQ